MKCPYCNETLVMADRQGIEIDYCPNCRGVWLDRGELDKIIERTANYTPPPQQQSTDSYNKDRDHYERDKHHPHNDPYYKHKKKKGFLSDFFDFD